VWYTILITLVVDVGGLIIIYAVLKDRLRRATTAEAQIAEIRDEVSSLLVELNQTTDRNIVLMEDRIASLNDLLAAADKKIGLLQREIEKHDVGTKIYSRLAEGRPAPSSAPPRESEPPARAVAPASARQAAARTVSPAGPPPEEAPAVPPLAVELSLKPERVSSRAEQWGLGAEPAARAAEGDVRQRVMMLYRSGFSPSLIASRVGAPLGEVELIISLEQRKGKA
jgi:hypothetical protein